MEFVAIDFETANSDMASVCQVGIAEFQEGCITKEWKSYINPEDYFDPINVSIHGIDEKIVRDAPALPDISDQLYEYLNGRICVCHTHFDRVAATQAFNRYNLSVPTCTWLDSARISRRAWEQFSNSGYGLKNVCDYLGYSFQHHDALEDAKAAGYIVLKAIEMTGLDIQGWLKRIDQPIFFGKAGIAFDGNPEGSLYGDVIVFTGALEIPRSLAAKMAAKIGCTVATGVNKNTTILVVGDQDVMKLAGHEKSSKHRKAETLILNGQRIQIIRESDFKHLVNMDYHPIST
jgi:DNA polymerase-3 subunit epsilon